VFGGMFWLRHRTNANFSGTDPMKLLLLAGAATLALISAVITKVPPSAILHDDLRWAEGLTPKSPR
jgi:hypothetical protein